MSNGDVTWGYPHMATDWDTPYGQYQCYQGHTWIDTGTNRTWCKHCDVDGDSDSMTGIVTVVYRPKDDHKRGTE